MGAIGLNPIRLDRIGLDPIRINAIKLGVPGASSGSDRPYIDPEVLASLKAVCICYGKSNDDPDRSIVKNLVDPDNPFVISNAAYKLNSGFGKYETELSNTRIWTQSKETTSSPFSSNYNGLSGWIVFANIELTNSADMPSFKIQVKGLLEGQELIYRYYDSNGQSNVYSMGKDGEYTLPADIRTAKPQTSNTSGFQVVKNDTNTITITQIPSFVGAFVTDGIDDLITSTKTVQEMLGGSNEITVVSMTHKMSSDGNWSNLIGELKGNHTFVANVARNTDKTGIYGYTYDGSKDAVVINNILGDEKDYTCRTATSLGLNNKYYVTGFENVGTIQGVSQVAWYWTFIANKVLTTDQINQVIAYFNLDRTLNPDILCNTIKQGITNENHAEFGDKLIDFSGNGRDIQLNNIAWKGDSGIGKYEVDFSTLGVGGAGLVYERLAESLIIINSLDTQTSGFSNIQVITTALASFKIKIEGLKEGERVRYHYNKNTDDTARAEIDYTSDGIYELPASVSGNYSSSIAFGYTLLGNSKIIITQIPSQAGALCLDGVNDFGKVTGMPIYKDYTVVTDREIFTNTGAILSKNNPGAFVETAENSVYSFGQATSGLNFISTRSISYLSKYSYCGQSITAGAAEDGTDMWLGTIRDNDSRFFNGAIYSLMTFPYSMSEFLIERQLKKHKLGTLYPNMVEFRPIVKSNLPYSSISYSVNPGEYISVDSMVTITVTLPNTSDKLMEVSCNAISDISISGDNGVYEITGKIVKSPQKINMIISSYLTMLSNSTLISNETLIKNE